MSHAEGGSTYEIYFLCLGILLLWVRYDILYLPILVTVNLSSRTDVQNDAQKWIKLLTM